MITVAVIAVTLAVVRQWGRANRSLRWTLDEIAAEEFVAQIAVVKPRVLLHPPTPVRPPLHLVTTKERTR